MPAVRMEKVRSCLGFLLSSWHSVMSDCKSAIVSTSRQAVVSPTDKPSVLAFCLCDGEDLIGGPGYSGKEFFCRLS